MARVYLQCRRRFWLEENPTAHAVTDLPIEWVEDDTFRQPGIRAVLEAHTTGPQARHITAMKEGERISFALKQMEQLYPGLREQFEGGASKCWDEDEWNRGAYIYFKPGQISSLLPAIARPEGRVYFAGEHTSPACATMNGALESGNRAAREVNEAA